ncbi:hypothetical protein MMC13_000924 [Lambiella insularis]|nr:hypothetical protein [Lambiella insularis]
MKTTIKTDEQETILLFGGHVLSQTKQTLDKRVQDLVEGPNADWIKETVAGLSSYWDALINEIPEVAGAILGSNQVADLHSWLRHGRGSDGLQQDENLPNIVVGPLLVPIQLDQYWRYLELLRSQQGLPRVDDLQADLVTRQADGHGSKVEVLGFCVGLLGTIAVSSSFNRQDFEKYGAAAMRMAMFIGALLDAREVWDKGIGKGKSVSYATAWRNTKQHEDLSRIVSSLFPEAYVSVLFDKARTTVTTSERTASSLVRQLRAAGHTVAEMGIDGHIHAPGPERERHTKAIVKLCHEKPGLQFAEASLLALPTYDNHGDGIPISPGRGDMTEMVLSSILMLQCDWYGTVSKIMAHKNDALVVAFGLDRCIPPTLLRGLGSRQQHFEDIEKSSLLLSRVQLKLETPNRSRPRPPSGHGRIAVVGMSIKVAGADDLDEFVDMLKSGQSQHELITRDKLQHEYLHRERVDANPNRKFYANIIRDSDAFDHKFFKRSPRESQAIDPQSRLCLEGAYQAVEQSGYFSKVTTSDSTHDKLHVGVYLGNCGVDYEHNIACHPATPFTPTGGRKSFIVGRLSHYFGWTGPSVTFDTACSSSTTAIHTACRNILAGECSAALCGGVNVITNMLWMQNLSAGSFISHTGQCKPFDDDADGYCRAEGIAFVLLKKLSDAIADSNPILATISATAVYQSLNCTPLFVLNSPSLSRLFKDVIQAANLEANDISLVEAHGTGTPDGDPAEYESVRIAIGGPTRKKPLPVGSVKGHIGHTEGLSGIIALIKVIMMMRHSFIPAQASFKKLNHQIQVRPDDMIEIPTSLRPWVKERKIALINNYGACGSNASMVIAQPPTCLDGRKTEVTPQESSRFPFWIAGLDAKSIVRYSAKLTSWLQLHAGSGEITLADLSFSMSRQSNRTLPQGLVFSCESWSELNSQLRQTASATKENAEVMGIMPTKSTRPVILCFGGQVSKFVGLDRNLQNSVTALRWHLGECDAAIKSAGLESIYPDIFSQKPILDTVELQTMLFALQYSCAKTWMDCGLQGKISAVIGHSFGEITALYVSGVLSLADTVKLVAGRARLVRDSWGPDSGAMLAVEAEKPLLQELLREANRISNGSAGIACYNGPRGFTVAGSTRAIDETVEILAGNNKFSGIKSKRLSVTNAFHSVLVDKLMDGLGQVGKELIFHEPNIPVEHATERKVASTLDWSFVPLHMRDPVFFDQAIHRLSKQYPQAIFLEAGSSSTITVMAARALAQTSMTPYTHHFQAMSITNNNKNKSSLDTLTDATVAMWNQGCGVSFWPHHPKQAREYAQLLLPPYQFDKSGRHWLEMKSPAEEINKAAEAIVATRGLTMATAESQKQSQDQDPRLMDLYTFVGYQDKESKRPRFRVNTTSDKYQHFFSGHIIAQTAPICPATLESDMAIEALFSLYPEWKTAGFSPVLRDLVNHSPICADPSRTVYIDFDASDKSKEQYGMKMSSVNAANKNLQIHVEAQLHFRSPADPAFIRALLSLSLGDEQDDIDVLRGPNVYRALKDIVDYPPLYRGVRSIVGRDNESAGIVSKRHQGQTWLDVPLSDSFSQVGGMWVNLMTDTPPGEMYIATGAEVSMRSPRVQTAIEGRENGPSLWHVLAQHTRKSDKEFMTDVLVFDAATGTVCEAMLGIQYGRVAKESISKMLRRLTTDESVLKITKQPPALPAATIETTNVVAAPIPTSSSYVTDAVKSSEQKRSSKESKPSRGKDINEEVRDLVATVSGIESSEFDLDTEMADLGIDSLMGMELAREVEIVFKCTIDQSEQMEATTLRKFVTCVSNTLARAGSGEEEDEESDTNEALSSEGDAGTRLNDMDTDISTPDDTLTPEKEAMTSGPGTLAKPSGAAVSNLTLSRSDILECFGEVKMLTDELIHIHHLDTIHKVELAGSNRLCAALVVEQMEKLYALTDSCFGPKSCATGIFRAIQDDILRRTKFERCPSGKTDGIRVIFGTPKGRQLVQAMYCEHTFNCMNYLQMRDVISRLADRIKDSQPGETLKILEMGAGTGGTTLVIAPFLASLEMPVEYTFTDLSPSMVVNARRTFGKQYPFM